MILCCWRVQLEVIIAQRQFIAWKGGTGQYWWLAEGLSSLFLRDTVFAFMARKAGPHVSNDDRRSEECARLTNTVIDSYSSASYAAELLMILCAIDQPVFCVGPSRFGLDLWPYSWKAKRKKCFNLPTFSCPWKQWFYSCEEKTAAIFSRKSPTRARRLLHSLLPKCIRRCEHLGWCDPRLIAGLNDARFGNRCLLSYHWSPESGWTEERGKWLRWRLIVERRSASCSWLRFCGVVLFRLFAMIFASEPTSSLLWTIHIWKALCDEVFWIVLTEEIRLTKWSRVRLCWIAHKYLGQCGEADYLLDTVLLGELCVGGGFELRADERILGRSCCP